MKNTLYTIIALVLFCFITQQSYAQRNRWKEHNFKDSTSLSYVDEKYKNEDAVIIKRVSLIEYKGFLDYSIQKTSYKLIRINNDIGLEAFNKIYIPMYGVKDIIDIEVRFISPDGNVTNLQRNEIRKIENLEGYGDFTVFAIKGAEVGGEIEYKYTLKLRAAYSHLEVFYNKYPIQESRFELVAPSDLKIHIKGYNGFPDFEVDKKGRKAWYATLHDVQPFEEEDFALNATNRIKAAYGVNKRSEGTYGYWSNMVSRKHSFLNNFTKSHEKIARRISTELGLDTLSLTSKIERIRNFAMDSIVLINYYYQLDFKMVLNDRIAASTGSKFKVMSILLYVNNIDFKTLWATDKYYAEYITDYPFSFNQDRFLFYFPGPDAFLDPLNRMYPLGIIPVEYLDTKAYFVKGTSGSLGHINPVDTSKSKELVNINVNIDSNWNTQIKSRFEMYGYKAAEFRSFLTHLDEDNEKELFEELHSTHMLDLVMEDVHIKNDSINPDNYPQLPLVLEFEMESNMIIDRAGDDYIFNLGRLLRNSIDFYHQEERVQDIIIDNPQAIYTNIEFVIPEGYKIKNLNEFKQYKAYSDSSGAISYFLETDYVQDANKLKFKITEANTKCRYPAEDFMKLREVINAISDLSFMKFALVPNEKTEAVN